MGSQPLSEHQSAAVLCHWRRVSVSARWRYHLLVSCLIASFPFPSKGTMPYLSGSTSLLRTGMRRTMRQPISLRSSAGRDQNAAELQKLMFTGWRALLISSNPASMVSRSLSHSMTPAGAMK